MKEIRQDSAMETYEPPKVEVIEVKVERGFAASGYGEDTVNEWEFE